MTSLFHFEITANLPCGKNKTWHFLVEAHFETQAGLRAIMFLSLSGCKQIHIISSEIVSPDSVKKYPLYANRTLH